MVQVCSGGIPGLGKAMGLLLHCPKRTLLGGTGATMCCPFAVDFACVHWGGLVLKLDERGSAFGSPHLDWISLLWSAQARALDCLNVFCFSSLRCLGKRLGPPVVPFYPFFGEGSPSKIDYRKTGTLILTSLLEDLGEVLSESRVFFCRGSLAGIPKNRIFRRRTFHMWQALRYIPNLSKGGDVHLFECLVHSNVSRGGFCSAV